MQIEDAFTGWPIGWDFVGETDNDTEDIWCICEGQDYPKLTWQFVVGDFDGDKTVDFADFCILAEHWLQSDSSFFSCRGADLTNNGLVDFHDLSILAENLLSADQQPIRFAPPIARLAAGLTPPCPTPALSAAANVQENPLAKKGNHAFSTILCIRINLVTSAVDK
jgi:hypothetical protein